MQETKVVLGAGFGDESKGATVQWLCKEALSKGKKPLVIRFSGGSQSAHTIWWNGIEHICSSFGSGVLLGVPTYYSAVNVLFDPICLVNELIVLNKKRINPVFDVSNAPIITPYDVKYNRLSSQILKDGTCGKGVYVSLQRSMNGKAFHLYDDPETILDYCAKWYNFKRDHIWDRAFKNCLSIVRQLNTRLNPKDYDVLIYEGTQGLLLDAELGFKPNVTATGTGLKDTCLKSGDVYLVTRTYLTRHGNGYNPMIPKEVYKADETNVFNEFQGNFKTGALEFDLLNYGFQAHQLKSTTGFDFNLVISHMDEVMTTGKFSYLNNGRLSNTLTVSPDTVVGIMKDNLDLDFTNVFWSDNKYSRFTKQL